ncbi:MAG TPA: glycosyltransferase family 2 protein, partial [Puia sp.]|nr:glycosyltransferase family 2 protein [Puia sp.]
MAYSSAAKPSQKLAVLTFLFTLVLAFIYTWFIISQSVASDLSILGWLLIIFKIVIEVCALFYGVSFVFIGLTYVFTRPAQEKTNKRVEQKLPTIGVIFLCCNDIDPDAFASIEKLEYEGDLHVFVHDDSVDVAARLMVDDLVDNLRRKKPAMHLEVLRRPVKGGGKSSAVNYVLQETGALYDYFILCDNDSTFLDARTIEKALHYVVDDKIAIVQFRIVGIDSDQYCSANSYLIKCIDAFHVFMKVFSRYGWQPFVGHNAMLRTKPVLDAGGFTPGFFSDDLDMTVRLNLQGYKVAYGSTVVMGEKPPPSYASFRKRSYKWAYGCVQSVRAHLLPVLKSRQFSFAEKQTFLFFTGFYFMQGALLIYLILNFLIFPFLGIIRPNDVDYSILAGIIIILTIFFPFLAYFVKEKNTRNSLLTIIIGGLTYGTTDFQSFRGICDCLRHKKREWVPTNQLAGYKAPGMLIEALFGIVLFLPTLFYNSTLLFLPSSYLFIGKFMFVPALYLFYDDRRRQLKSPSQKISFKLGRAFFLIATLLILTPLLGKANGGHGAPDQKVIEIKGKSVYVNGKQFTVQGINYSPWRPGTGPNKNYPYPSPTLINEDLKIIQKLHANTILVYDPPAYVLDLSAKDDLLVIYTFSINWWTLGTQEFEREKERILKKIETLKGASNILAWELGNEIPAALLQKVKADTIETEMKDLYNAIKTMDPSHFIIHGNWPPTKSLKFDFFDLTCFNVYPVWPPEVVAHGYGNYISNFLQPIANEKPLLITEFGVNSLEAGEDGQARITGKCWEELLQAGACGGIVFSFADEWWKNYDNPASPDQWWDRKAAVNDEMTHDSDPEEYYGILASDRTPKPVYKTVEKMFGASIRGGSEKIVPSIAFSTLTLLALGAWLWARKGFSAIK